MSQEAFAIIAAILAALGTGGTMGAAIIAIANRLVVALIKQNAELTESINANTSATKDLSAAIEMDLKLNEQANGSRRDQLNRIESNARYAAENTKELAEKLRGRL